MEKDSTSILMNAKNSIKSSYSSRRVRSSSEKSSSCVHPQNGISTNHNSSLPADIIAQSDSSPYKSPTFLSFDPYGNLTATDDPKTVCSHEVPSLAEFDDILNSFEGKLRVEPSKSKAKKSKASNKKKPVLTETHLKEVIKSELDNSITPTSRYGRARKLKSQDGFLFGTINFNALRKVTNSKNASLSFNEGKSDYEGNNGLDNSVDLSKNFGTISNNILDYSSDDEFTKEAVKSSKNNKMQKRKSLPATLENKSKKVPPSDNLKEEVSIKKKRGRPLKISTNIIKSTEKKTSPKKESSNFRTRSNSKSFPDLAEEKLNIKEEKIDSVLKEEVNIGSIQEDLKIIKSSLCRPKSGRFSPLKELPDTIMADSTDDEASEVKDVIVKKEPIDTPEVLQIETLGDGVKPVNLPKTKFGRAVKKPELIDITKEASKRKSMEKPMSVDTLKNDSFEELGSKKLDKLYPRVYFVGDVVWVIMKGNPIWPALVTYSHGDSDYTRIIKSCNSQDKKLRQYNVQFFYDNFKTTWVPASRLFSYAGLDNLESYLKSAKSSDYMTKNLRKSFSKMYVFMHKDKTTHSKTFNWYEALDEADRALKMDRYQRIESFSPPLENEDVAKSTNESAYSTPPVKRKYNKIKREASNDETSSVKSKSSEDFSGFEDDSSTENRKIKRMKLEELTGGDFEIYLQKHLSSSVNDLHMSEERATKLLRKRWTKLTPLQKSRYKSKTGLNSLNSNGGNDTTKSPSVTKSKRVPNDDGVDIAKGLYRVPKQEKVCFNCEDVSANNGHDMVKCKGVCGGCFHLKCLGLSSLPKNDFKCAFCLSGVHNCFLCKSSEGERFKCSVTFCGKFYHMDCVNVWPQTTKSRLSDKLVCPRHVCHMCAANADDMNDAVAKTPPFTRCLRCPTSYHTGETCIAAGSEDITHNFHICPKHMQVPKNNSHHFNVNWCFCCSKGGSLLLCDQCPAAFHAECLNITAPEGSYVCEDCVNGKFPVFGDIVWVKLGAYRWWPGEVLHPRHIPDNIENLAHTQGMFCVHFFGSDDYYWVSRGRTFHYQEGDQGSKYSSSKFLQQKFQKALEEALVAYKKQQERRVKQEESLTQKGSLKPAPFVKIDTNKPVGNVKLGKLDISTVNKCDCDPYMEKPCNSDNKCLNRMLMVECVKEVCSAKERCHNQRFQKRQYPNVVPFKTAGRGWGLKTNDFIKKGDFVIEYVGELIDDAEFKRRIEKMHECKEDNYYFLTVEPDRIIDAGPKGNLARFMNHCCLPNCETQKWTVGADTRVGLFALEDISEGSEVTFNYNFLCVGTDKKKCNCESSNCSGFIGAKVQEAESTAKKDVATKKKKNKKRKMEKDWENECFRCSGPGNLILCDITSCPKGYHLECLGLKNLPKGKWLCPWHHCDECGSRSVARCVMCPNSYCKSHSVDKFHSHPGFTNICLDHEEEHLETLRGQKEEAQGGPNQAEKPAPTNESKEIPEKPNKDSVPGKIGPKIVVAESLNEIQSPKMERQPPVAFGSAQKQEAGSKKPHNRRALRSSNNFETMIPVLKQHEMPKELDDYLENLPLSKRRRSSCMKENQSV